MFVPVRLHFRLQQSNKGIPFVRIPLNAGMRFATLSNEYLILESAQRVQRIVGNRLRHVEREVMTIDILFQSTCD